MCDEYSYAHLSLLCMCVSVCLCMCDICNIETSVLQLTYDRVNSRSSFCTVKSGNELCILGNEICLVLKRKHYSKLPLTVCHTKQK